jgi:hypothetical protein
MIEMSYKFIKVAGVLGAEVFIDETILVSAPHMRG